MARRQVGEIDRRKNVGRSAATDKPSIGSSTDTRYRHSTVDSTASRSLESGLRSKLIRKPLAPLDGNRRADCHAGGRGFGSRRSRSRNPAPCLALRCGSVFSGGAARANHGPNGKPRPLLGPNLRLQDSSCPVESTQRGATTAQLLPPTSVPGSTSNHRDHRRT